MNMTVNITPTSPQPVDSEKFDQFEKELARLVNESLSNTQVSGLEFFRI